MFQKVCHHVPSSTPVASRPAVHIACGSALHAFAGDCKYTVHEDDVQWDAAQDAWNALTAREKDR